MVAQSLTKYGGGVMSEVTETRLPVTTLTEEEVLFREADT
jgi:hypothetical protein